ncbi:hypothetical protein C8Q76DRAFT_729650 [Earliella scabrosa]|nr:hypothetical protein C8Q76DRAFT_729650 [Earliella scabrosa]
MAAPALPEEQLLELLLTLKRTTPNEARTILNSQPQIAYALMSVMVNINAVKMEVVQDILAKYGAPSAPSAASVAPAPVIPPQPPSAIPPHMQAQMPPRGGTPTYPPHGPQGGYPPPNYPGGPPPPPTGPGGQGRGYSTPPPAPGQVPGFASPAAPGLSHGPGPHGQPPPHVPPHAPPPQRMAHVPPPPAGPAAPVLPEALAALPEEQKALIMRVIVMSREEVYQMPPAERENIIKLRTTLGLPI